LPGVRKRKALCGVHALAGRVQLDAPFPLSSALFHRERQNMGARLFAGTV